MKPQNPGELWGPARPLSFQMFLLKCRPQSSWSSYKILILGGDSRQFLPFCSNTNNLIHHLTLAKEVKTVGKRFPHDILYLGKTKLQPRLMASSKTDDV